MAKIKRVICNSGLVGEQSRLRDRYSDFEDWRIYSQLYGLGKRLGYSNDLMAWQANPMIQSSSNPDDFRVVKISQHPG